MKSLSLYVERASPLHALDPITKLVYAASLSVVPFLAGDLRVTFAALALNLALLALSRVLRQGLVALAGLGFFLATIFVVQGLAYRGNVTPVAGIGPLVLYREGLAVAIELTARFVNLTMSAFVLLFSTPPADLIGELVRAGLSPRVGYVLQSVLQIVPSMAGAISTIQDAQRSRGMETEGRLWTRMRAFVPLLGPLVTSSLVSMQERAMALEARAFGATGRRTFYRPARPRPFAWPVRAASVAAVFAALAWGLVR